MKNLLVSLCLLFLFSCAEKQTQTPIPASKQENESHIPAVSSYFPENKAKVLVLGTFHFDYPGLDDHKTIPENQIDVLKEPKKSEITELVEYIKKFQPNKIAIEASAGYNATEKLREYKAGGLRDQRGERVQLGMRIATELNLDTLYSVDAYSIRRDLYKKDTTLLKELIGGVNWELEDPYWNYVESWMDEDDKLVSKTHLIDYFKHTNSRESHAYGYGIYLLSSFKSENYQGADFLSMWWYNRNLRIFRNIQDISEGPEDRILVLFGNGHAAILRQLFEASPEYQFVEFSSL